ncbi:MAG: methylated-DNA--[protein]-cysteine S-methyltransferase, partial [Betaproteobacteria bacterium]|nr:methylated-DNA--[protein]-cysteine S-methyltransferase [Betaproteobacteria bacterium]
MNQPRARLLRGGLRVNDPGVAWDAVLVLPFGRLGVRCSATELLQSEYLPGPGAPSPAPPAPPALAALVGELQAQLLAYCRDPRHAPRVPMAPAGSVFQARVWSALQDIPVGSTLSYGELARQLGSSARAVGGACASNPFAPLVPCHRVVARAGLGGFAGSTEAGGDLLGIKRWL